MLPGQLDWFAPQENKAADQKTLAERAWRAPLKPAAIQRPCDVGLFSGEANQLDLMEMFLEPTNE